MNVFAKFDEISSMILEVIKTTKRYGYTVGWSDMKTVYPPTNTVCGGYNDHGVFVIKILNIIDRSKAVVLLQFSVFGVRVPVTFHLTCVHIILSSVWVAEWPPFGK